MSEQSILLCHLGAGIHSSKKKSLYKRLLGQCSAVFQETRDVEELLSMTSQILESSPLTNTGYGSSLTINGTVQSDASVLIYRDEKLSQASVCCSKQQYPISHAMQVFQDQARLNRFGITRPVFIVDTGNSDNSLVSPELLQKFNCYKEMMEDVSDTIGVIITTPEETISASSSGGNMFKEEGRVGSAAIVGASHWQLNQNGYKIVLMSSGNGEDIMLMDLCRSCCCYVLDQLQTTWQGTSYAQLLWELVQKAASNVNLKAINDQGTTILYVGVYGLLQLPDGKQIVIMCHSTESFIVSYTIKGHSSPTNIFSHLTNSPFNTYEEFLDR